MILTCNICQTTIEVDTEEQARGERWFVAVQRGMPDAVDGAGEVHDASRLFPGPLVHCFCPPHGPNVRDTTGARAMMGDAWQAAVAKYFPNQ